MYINRFNQETDQERILAFIRENNFGSLVSYNGTFPVATHLPFLIAQQEDSIYLTSHLARANPQWKGFNSQTEVLVIFQGAHAFISPRWYDHMNVPTMNYIAVHAYGKLRIVEEYQELYKLLQTQVEQYEGKHIQEYNITSIPEKMLRDQMKALVGIEIRVNRMEANFKLSQNRDEKNYINIIRELESSEKVNDRLIAAHMKKVWERKGYNIIKN